MCMYHNNAGGDEGKVGGIAGMVAIYMDGERLFSRVRRRIGISCAAGGSMELRLTASMQGCKCIEKV